MYNRIIHSKQHSCWCSERGITQWASIQRLKKKKKEKKKEKFRGGGEGARRVRHPLNPPLADQPRISDGVIYFVR